MRGDAELATWIAPVVALSAAAQGGGLDYGEPQWVAKLRVKQQAYEARPRKAVYQLK